MLSKMRKSLQWESIPSINECISQYYTHSGPINLKELLQELKIPQSQLSSHLEYYHHLNYSTQSRHKSLRSKFNWNDPLQAYTAILEFLEEHSKSVKPLLNITTRILFNENIFQKQQSFLLAQNWKRIKHDVNLWEMLDGDPKSKTVEKIASISKFFVLAVDRHRLSGHASFTYKSIEGDPYSIEIDEQMEIPGELCSSHKSVPLKLLGIVNHDSRGTHAFSFVSHNDKWYRCDDERVTEIRFSEIKHSTRNASMLIFRNMAWEKQ